MWWVGVIGYAVAGVGLAYWGWRRVRACALARRERQLFETRSLEYQDLAADQGLRLLLFHTQALLDKDVGTLAGIPPNEHAPASPEPAATLRPGPPALERPAALPTPRAPASAVPEIAPVRVLPSRPVDVYVSYRHSTITRQWLKEFVPLFNAWLSESLGRESVVYVDEADALTNADWLEQLRGVAEQARCFLALLTPTYFSYEFTRSEWDRASATRARSIVPLWFQGEAAQFPLEVQALQLFDFRDFALVGEGFTRSDKYVEFQARVQRLADGVAQRIADAAPAA